MSKDREESFEVRSNDAEFIVKIGEDGKICYTSISEMEMKPVWVTVDGNPHSEESIINVDYAFETMLDLDIETFKAMLNRIKESDPEYFNKGLALLQNKKEQAIKQAEEMYSF